MKIAIEITPRAVVRWILGLLLIWASLSKLANLQQFHSDLAAYALPLPDFLMRTGSFVLPWVELLCGLMLLSRVYLDSALLCAFGLFVIFVISTGQAWLRHLQIDCGCFDLTLIGIQPESDLAKLLKSTGFAFCRALLLTAGSLYVWRGAESRRDMRTAAA